MLARHLTIADQASHTKRLAPWGSHSKARISVLQTDDAGSIPVYPSGLGLNKAMPPTGPGPPA